MVVAAAAMICVVYVCVSVGVVNVCVLLPSEVWPFPPVWAVFVCVGMGVGVVVGGSAVVPSVV